MDVSETLDNIREFRLMEGFVSAFEYYLSELSSAKPSVEPSEIRDALGVCNKALKSIGLIT